MKHLKKFENKDEFEDIFEEIKSILIELKDEYTYLEGEIFLPEKGSKTFKGDPDEQIEIHLECENIFNKEIKKGTIEYSKLKLKFIEMVILSTERLESALNKVSYTSNLWNWDHWQDTKIKITLY